MTNTILVTGSTGYIASRLIPRLLEAGYRVRCLARKPDRLRARRWFGRVEIVAGDVTRPETLPAAMQGVSAAYYLVHSMASGHGYDRLDLVSARNFSFAARDAGVKHIIYLGGLSDPADKLALHLRSRIETGKALREAGVPVTEFRAGVIVGPGSVSFEMIRFIAEQFPLILGPSWLRHRSQPVATPDVLAYLVAALETPACWGKTIGLGCEKERTYIDVISEYARIRALERRALLLPFIPPFVMAFFVDLLTPVEFSYALPLVEGLQNDSLVLDRSPLSLFPTIRPLDYAEAVRRALDETNPDEVERIWLEKGKSHVRMRHEGMLVDYREDKNHSPSVISQGERGLPKIGGVETWETVENVQGGTLRWQARGKIPGRLWLERGTTPGGRTSQTVFFMPFGLPGFLFWGLNVRYFSQE